ncbi:hypothetical protein Y032_0350g3217 [Ancylostoma ceylanicum]|uniref:Uncharacterized protein n=1 Tax=Ancylostoma ceylanicum TaxID=53326 RepID=A0A016RWW4_9BILA|nr:hypothetical protein Y032_0350g3217 [Ancylostoma ceylanicum]
MICCRDGNSSTVAPRVSRVREKRTAIDAHCIVVVVQIQCWFLRRRRRASARQQSCKARLLRWLFGSPTTRPTIVLTSLVGWETKCKTSQNKRDACQNMPKPMEYRKETVLLRGAERLRRGVSEETSTESGRPRVYSAFR